VSRGWNSRKTENSLERAKVVGSRYAIRTRGREAIEIWSWETTEALGWKTKEARGREVSEAWGRKVIEIWGREAIETLWGSVIKALDRKTKQRFALKFIEYKEKEELFKIN
jgi:hypothetical protein